MKTIKINFCGFWGSFKPQNNMFTNILSRYFNVEISDKPDLLICSNRGLPFEYMKYDCPRLMFMGENMSPDWTVFDYCIGFDFMDFGDRYFRLPLAFYNDDAQPWRPEILTEKQAATILRGEKVFLQLRVWASLIAWHARAAFPGTGKLQAGYISRQLSEQYGAKIGGGKMHLATKV